MTELVEQYVYTHMANVPGRKQLIDLVRDAEEKYLRRIAELEQDAAVAALNRAADGEVDFDAQLQRFEADGNNQSKCTCHQMPEGTACPQCVSKPIYHTPAYDDEEERW